ncbi:sulfotransferase domain-containing protein [Methylobacillus flagellatus]|uniref:sulfotransferase domain-containing protein n=1 Tax=Methylobacillus flagellatus TaxID=405 RepID=UPI0010F56F52|nr:sulfotransferase domain-containing protein [Methylobacillus flagellatus]
MIIGAQKCGTTSLHYYLNQHPMFFGSQPKELHFFDEKMPLGKSLEWYERHFSGPAHGLYYESTPAYLYRPDVAERLHAYSSTLKLVVILRDPVERAYSAYNHYRSRFEKHADQGFEHRTRHQIPGIRIQEMFYEGRTVFPTFRETLEMELAGAEQFYEPAILRRGLYAAQLQRYWQLFGREQLLILGFKELIQQPLTSLGKVSQHLGLNDIDWGFVDVQARNVKPYVGKMTAEDRQFLQDYYAEPNQQLLQLTGPLHW